MKEREPRKKRSYTRVDLVCDVFGAACLLAMFLLVAVYWKQLPERIPTHYGFDGQPTAWGGRVSVVIMPLACLLLYVLMTLSRIMPESMYNSPVRLTEENRERQLALSRELLSVIKCCLLLSFLPLLILMLQGRPLPGWLVGLQLALILIPIVVYIVRMVKNK